ncbi:glycosyltransferase family 4 protein [bacterium]|nr:glycosyltransferase family 4 protein [bacterium]
MNKSAKKTILFYTDTHFYGGAENQMYLLAKFLDKEKYNVILVCSDFEKLKEWASKFEAEGIEVIKLSVFHKHDPRHYFQLKEIVKNRKIDLMHIHMWNPASCRYALMVANKYNIPTIVTEHDPFELTGLKGYIKSRLVRNVKKIISVSDANRQALSKLFPSLSSRIVTIHNGIDVTWFESQLLSFSEGKIKEFREKIFGVDNNYKVILSVAELHERKGLKHLIKAMPTILETDEKIKLVLVGTGPARNDLKQLALKEGVIDDVLFLGFRKDIPHLMASSNIFVLPSEKEAFGLVLLEAGIAGLPVVASFVGGIPEIIENNVNGILIPPKIPGKLAKSILEIFNNDFKRKSYIEEGYKHVKNKFDAKKMAEKTSVVYDEILKSKS